MAPAKQKLASGLPQQWQTKPDLAVQHHQLHKQVYAVQVSCHLHLPLWLCETWTPFADWKKGSVFRNQVLKDTSPLFLPGPTTGSEANQLSRWSTGISSGNYQETETCMVRACHTPRQPLQNSPSGHLGGCATPWSAEAMLDEQHQSGHPCPCQNCWQGPPAEKTGRGNEDLCWIVSHVPLATQTLKGLNWTELPPYLSALLSTYQTVRTRRSSGEKFLKSPERNLKSVGEGRLNFIAPSVWNSLPASLRNRPTLSGFKVQLQTFLFRQAFSQI